MSKYTVCLEGWKMYDVNFHLYMLTPNLSTLFVKKIPPRYGLVWKTKIGVKYEYNEHVVFEFSVRIFFRAQHTQ